MHARKHNTPQAIVCDANALSLSVIQDIQDFERCEDEWDALVRRLLAEVPALTAVSRLSLRIDGRRLPACTNAVIEPGELVWPGSHLLEVVAEERAA